ncbi:MAG: dienelactone hydrolase family protein [Candidatus Cloacimonetes bacterium]|nr:dienelactone hydrolase family protein [Candidatus Cloacimonadota bacterium]
MKRLFCFIIVIMCCTILAQDSEDLFIYGQEEFEVRTLLNYVIELPENYDPDTKYPLIIGLHGYGDKPESYRGTARILFPEGAIGLYPQGPYRQLNEWGRSPGFCWSYITEDNEDRMTMLDTSLRWVLNILEKTLDSYSVDRSKVFLYGFSQGGMMSYQLGLTYPEYFRGVIPAGAFIDNTVDSLVFNNTAAKRLPYLALHGVYDQVIDPDWDAGSIEKLKSYGFNADLKLYPTAHSIIQPMLDDARDFIYQELYEGDIPSLEKITRSKDLPAELDKILLLDDDAVLISSSLQQLYKMNKDAETREKIVYLLGAERCIDAMGFLTELMMDKTLEQSNRQAAFNALAKLENETAWEIYQNAEYKLVVKEVVDGSQAAELGIMPGDIILSYNGQVISYRSDVVKAKEMLPPDQETIEMIINRNGNEIKLELKPGSIGVYLDEILK